MAVVNIKTPLGKKERKKLRAGDHVRISGIIYTARDAAHKRMMESLEQGLPLPMDFTDEIIYYVGPCPAKPGKLLVQRDQQLADEWIAIRRNFWIVDLAV